MAATTVGAILRSSQAYYGLICVRQTLDHGIAYYSKPLAALPQANQFREVVIENPADVARAYDAAERLFAGLGLTCHRWAPAEGARIPGLAELLADHGLVERAYDALTLTRWTAPGRQAPEGIRVLPARAMREAFAATFGAAALEHDAEVQRLDQASMDMFVALRGAEPAGRCALYQVGDIGRVIGPVVQPQFAEQGVEEALLACVLAMGQRLQMRTICTLLPAEDPGGRRLMQSFGFEADGRIFEYHRQPSKEGT
ncbi:MAG: GNAT family N-acetyltransferase [Phycisphaerales bacterium]|nr:GNAT family N-acetyltransferase [Phycisphaerales bacterium]